MDAEINAFLTGKSPHTLALYHHFISEFKQIGDIALHSAKTMIGIGNPDKRVAWITQLGKNFIHVVFSFNKPYNDNLCFQKIAQIPGQEQYNHHLRILNADDVNDEVKSFMKLAYAGE